MLRARARRYPHPIAADRQLSLKSLHASKVDDIVKGLLNLFNDLDVTSKHFVSRAGPTRAGSTKAKRRQLQGAVIGELLTVWHQDPRYLDSAGNPVPLKMRAPHRSFRILVDKAAPNIDPSQLLEQLQKVGAVSVDARQFIHVKMRSLPVYEDRQLAAQHTLSSLDGFIKTLQHNLYSANSNSKQRFHRIACNADFDPKEIPSLKIWAKRHGQNFLESSDNWMMRRAKSSIRKSNHKSKRMRVSIGVYLTVETKEESKLWG